MPDGGGVNSDLPPEPRPSHLASPRGRWSSGGDGGLCSGRRAGRRRLRRRLLQAGACRLLSWTLYFCFFLCYVTNIVLVENLIKENFNVDVCQSLCCGMQHPGALAPW